MTPPPATKAPRNATVVQRLRVRLLEVASWLANRLPAGVVGGVADAGGELWYRATPARAAQARANLGRVVAHLAATGTGVARARAAADDPAALERLVRAAYRQAARTYAELLRSAAVTREAPGRTRIETPDAVEAAFAVRPAIFASLHFGSLQATEAILLTRLDTPITAPMETLEDPALQAFMARARSASGVRLVGLEGARRELRAALGRGELVGVVGDRDIVGGGVSVPFFGAPAPLPVGPALLALESGAPIHVAAVRRLRGERFAGRLETIQAPDVATSRAGPVPGARASRRCCTQEVAVFERLVADAPEQWWAVFFPIWPDLAPERTAMSAGRHDPPLARRARPGAAPRPRGPARPHARLGRRCDDVEAILDHVLATTDLDVLGIADHERVDAAHRRPGDRADARAPGRGRGGRGDHHPRDGHLLALFLEERLRPFRSMRTTIGEVHEQGGLAIPAHPLVPLPALRAGLDAPAAPGRGRSPRPARRPRGVQPHDVRTARARAGRGVRRGSRPGRPSATATRTTRRRSAPASRRSPDGRPTTCERAIVAGTTGWEGSFHRTAAQLADVRPPAPQVRPRHRGPRSAGGCGVTAPAATWATRAVDFRPPRPDESAGVARPREDAS